MYLYAVNLKLPARLMPIGNRHESFVLVIIYSSSLFSFLSDKP